MYLYVTKGQAVSGAGGVAAGYLIGKKFKRPLLGAIAGTVLGWWVGRYLNSDGMADVLWSAGGAK